MLKGIKGIFFEEADTPPEVPVKAPSLPTAAPAFLNAATPSIPAGMVSSGKFKDRLLSEMQTKFAGSPYLQFEKIADGMKAQIADVATRTVATGAALTAQGIGKDKLLASANEALAFLKTEGETFQSEMALNMQALDQEFQTKSEKIAASLADKQEKIKVLSEEISALQIEKSQAEVALTENKTKLHVTKIEFEGCLNSAVQEITNDINDITRYGV